MWHVYKTFKRFLFVKTSSRVGLFRICKDKFNTSKRACQAFFKTFFQVFLKLVQNLFRAVFADHFYCFQMAYIAKRKS